MNNLVRRSAQSRFKLMMRHGNLVMLAAALLAVGLAGAAAFAVSRPVTLKIAVGPPNSDDLRFIQAMAQQFARERAHVRLQLVVKSGPAESAEALNAGEVDAAVVRRDLGMPKEGQVAVILRRNVAVLFTPPREPAKATAKKAKKSAKSANPKPQIEKIADLAGRRVGVIGKTKANVDLLNVILKQYGVSPDKVDIVQFDVKEITEAASAIRESKVDAVLAVGPINSRITADAIAASARSRQAPTFLPIEAAEAIAQRFPAYEAVEIPAGAFGGSPPRPEESIDTIGVAHYIVLRKKVHDQVAGDLTKQILAARQQLSAEHPGASKIEAPDTARESVVPVHPGAAAYIDGEQKTFFEQYGDALYWGLMLVSFIGSGAAGLMSYARADERARRLAVLDRLMDIVTAARAADSADQLKSLQHEADAILAETMREVQAGALDETMVAGFAVALDQARAAISERRAALSRFSAAPS